MHPWLHYRSIIWRIIFLAFFLKRYKFHCAFISAAYQQINLILEHNWNSFHHSISNFLNKVAQDLPALPVFITFRHFFSFYDGKKKVHLKFPLKWWSYCLLYIFCLAIYVDEGVHWTQKYLTTRKKTISRHKTSHYFARWNFPPSILPMLSSFFFLRHKIKSTLWTSGHLSKDRIKELIKTVFANMKLH